ncbi:hypothetical protein AB7M35_003692 [Amorphus suaedae]
MQPSAVSLEPVVTRDSSEARHGRERVTSPAVPWRPGGRIAPGRTPRGPRALAMPRIRPIGECRKRRAAEGPTLPAPPVIGQALSVSSGTMVDPPDVTREPFNRSSGRRATAVEGAQF